MLTKFCGGCNTYKSLSEFHRDINKSDKLCTHCKICSITRATDWRSRNRKHSQMVRRNRTITRHGLCQADYDNLFQSQNGSCAICRKESTSDRSLSLDHDHSCCPGIYSCGKCIRGLLCNQCNQALGLLEDNIDTIINMMTYIQLYWDKKDYIP